MALNIQIPYRGDQYLFQGISQAGQSMGGALEQVINKYKRDQDQGKAADYFYKSLGEGAEAMTGIHPEAWKTLGSTDKAQAMVGFMQSQTLKQLQAHVQEQQALAQAAQQRVEEQRAEGEALPQFMQQYDQLGQPSQGNAPQPNPQDLGPMGGGATPGGAMGLPALPGVPATDAAPWQGPNGTIAPAPLSGQDRVMQALSRVGRVSPKLGAAMARIILPHVLGAASEGSLSPSYTEDPVTGARNITFGKQLQSTGYNPAKVPQGLQVQHDPDTGKAVGFSFTDPRTGRASFHNAPPGVDLTPAMTPDGQPIPGAYVDGAGKVHDFRTTIQKLSGGGTGLPGQGNGGNAQGGPPKVTTQAQYDALAKGSVYIGKDGKKYRKP